ncbi:hypothetical protein PLICRDRAFT_141867 [Plicaturopsis crispa FD-325 SS-3]|nr:hypothetical protein PLICRDRAFT_141867 [Plicaturopsis crispa FD-325 SS-3]
MSETTLENRPADSQDKLESMDHQRQNTEPDAQTMLIESLRNQIQDLFTQVTQLNGKLVKSYDRVSDLEDDLHVASSNLRSSSVKISQLELERTQHLSALNTGLLVEKSHVTAELTRLMEKATEEAAQRGQAESARADIEKDLDDLSASLFGQANTMVAEARLGRAISEKKVEEAETALKGAEEAVGLMQQQMQALQAEKEKAEREAEEMRIILGKGKWVQKASQNQLAPTLRLLSSHLPYQEFLLFVAHLRSIHPASPNPPPMSTLLPLPFLARLVTEDSDPTVRLDLAPSLNWLSRRSVQSAIHNGQLIIEPMSTSTLLQEISSTSYSTPSLASPIIPGANANYTNIACALCGTPIFPTSLNSDHSHNRPPSHPLLRAVPTNGTNSTWSASLFKNPLNYTMTGSAHNSPPTTPPASQTTHNLLADLPTLPQQIYIFRVSAPTSTNSTVNAPVNSPRHTGGSSGSGNSLPQMSPTHQHSQSRSQITMYPLCTSGWCLTRLRMTCSLWAFVRSGVVEKVWDEEVPILPPVVQPKSISRMSGAADVNGKPPVPPRRKGLWGMATALGERASSWTGEGDKKDRERSSSNEGRVAVDEKKLPLAPPPIHPTQQPKTGPVHSVPPPLPKRSETRGRTVSTARAESPALTSASPELKGNDEEKATSEQLPAEPKPSAPTTDATSSKAAPENETNGLYESSSDELPTTTNNVAPEPAAAKSSASLDSDGHQNDSFTTPTEEINEPNFSSSPPQPSSANANPISPSAVALPESTANTPTAPSSFAEQQAAPPASQPTEASTPAPAPSVIDVKDVPSRTSSPAPPPLPRRAAARARRGSVAAPSPQPAKTPLVQVAAEASSPAIREEEEEESAPSHKEESAPSHKEESAPLQKEEDTPAAVVPTPINGDHENDDSKTISNGATVPAENGVSAAPLLNGTSEETGSTPETNGKDVSDQVYVGHATWEERTWKELVNLREELFWARIGGLR